MANAELEERVFSDPEVQEVLRQFICVRLDGRESAENAALKAEYGPVILGNVQNRIVSPSGENLAALPVHFDTDRLVRYLSDWSSVYPGMADPVVADRPLPYFASAHQALNVAACDARLLVLIGGDDDGRRADLAALAWPLAWSPEFAGRFHFATALPDDPTLREITGLPQPAAPALCLVAPDIFGMTGRVLAAFGPGAIAAEVVDAARTALAAHAARFRDRTLVEKFQLHTELGEREWSYV